MSLFLLSMIFHYPSPSNKRLLLVADNEAPLQLTTPAAIPDARSPRTQLPQKLVTSFAASPPFLLQHLHCFILDCRSFVFCCDIQKCLVKQGSGTCNWTFIIFVTNLKPIAVCLINYALLNLCHLQLFAELTYVSNMPSTGKVCLSTLVFPNR